MISDEQIRRINELANKSKNEGLTEKEKIEQTELRNQYLSVIRGSLKSQLDSIKILNVDEDGKKLQ